MDNPGTYTLCAQPITTAQAALDFTPIDDLDGMTAVTLEFEFLYGSGGSTASAVVKTSFDGGTTWRDIARADFTTASATKHCNLEGLLSKAMTAYAALGSEGVYDGVLGDQLKVTLIITGTYANTQLNVRASVR
jgi:hypothetical protein